MMESENKSKGSFILGILTGSIIGGVLGILYAPKSGKSTRRDIAHKKQEMVYEAEKYLDKAKERASGIIVDGKQKAGQIIGDAKEKIGTMVKSTEDFLVKGKDRTTSK